MFSLLVAPTNGPTSSPGPSPRSKWRSEKPPGRSCCHLTHDEMAFSEVVFSVWRPCLFSTIGNRYLNKTKTFHRVCVTKLKRPFGATLAALARGFSGRHFERGCKRDVSYEHPFSAVTGDSV